VTQTLTPLGFSAAGSSDPDDGIVSFAWNFGDGETATGTTPSHAFARAGTYTVTLTVTDHGGLTATDTARVTVANRPPVATTDAERTLTVGTAVTLADRGSYDLDGSITSYGWTFGDGGSAAGPTVDHTYAVPGTYMAKLTVTDDLGAQGSGTCMVTVTSAPPPPPPPGGGPSWSRRMGGAAADIGQAIAAGNDGSMVVGGRVGGTPTLALLAKYNAAGTQVWSRTSGGSGQAEVYAVSMNDAGDVFATGWFQGTIDLGGSPLTSTAIDLFIVKYAGADGRFLWATRYGGVASDIGYGIAADGDGVVVTGFFQSAADLGGGAFAAVFGGVDTFVARYSAADGRHLWSRNLGGASDDIGYGVVSDRSGGILLTGFFRARMSFGTATLISAGANDIFLAKLQSSNGQTIWARGFGGTMSERGYHVDVDSAGNALLTGFFQDRLDLGGGPLTSAGSTDVFVAKFAAATGTHLWSRGLGGTGEDYGLGIGVDSNDDVVVTGRFKDTVDFGGGPFVAAGASDAFVARYRGTTGTHLSSQKLGGPATDIANKVAMVGTRALVTGSFERTSTFADTSLTSAGHADLFLLSVTP
jgi:PKD repeat protein